MTYGTPEDLAALHGMVGKDTFCEALDHAPPGVFDRRSWAYWNLIAVATPLRRCPHACCQPVEAREVQATRLCPGALFAKCDAHPVKARLDMGRQFGAQFLEVEVAVHVGENGALAA